MTTILVKYTAELMIFIFSFVLKAFTITDLLTFAANYSTLTYRRSYHNVLYILLRQNHFVAGSDVTWISHH